MKIRVWPILVLLLCALGAYSIAVAGPSTPMHQVVKPKPTPGKKVAPQKTPAKGKTAPKSAPKSSPKAAAQKPAVKIATPVATPKPVPTPIATNAPASTNAQASGSSPLKAALGGKGGKDDVPVYIRSDNFHLDSKNRIFHYRENVEITKGDLVITADIVKGKYNDKDELEEVDCQQNVVITRGDRLRATSDHAVYYVKTGKIILTEGPELNDRGNVLSADRVIVYVDEDRSEAEGNVRVKVSKNEGQIDVESAIKKGEKTPTPVPGAATPVGTPAAPPTPGATP